MTKRKTTTTARPSRAKAQPTTDTAKANAAETVGATVSNAELAKARKDGVLEAAKEAAKASYVYATDGNLVGDPEDAPRTFPGASDIMQFEPLLKLDVEAFEAAIADNADVPVPEEKVYGLLGLERNGQNRTPYVQAMMKRLDLKADELPGGGPPYTNDVRPITKL